MPTRSEILGFDDSPPPPGASPWVVEPERVAIELVEYDPDWPAHAREVGELIGAALGTRAVRVEHVGSTAVPGLVAKPIIDLDLTVACPAAEAAWLPTLERAGFELTVREPWWHEHRMLRYRKGVSVNLHVFGPDSAELVKHVVFRDWLRANEADRQLYSAAKRAAADGPDQRVMDYNARKQAVILEIYERAFRAAGFLG